MRAALVILDGWGLGGEARSASERASGGTPRADHDKLDAVTAADTPNFDRLASEGAFGTLTTSGRDVGLPDGQMGNSEVGHLTIGAGQVVFQEYARIDDAIADGTLGENDAIASAFDYADEHDGAVHLLGLVSDGGVHSDQEHLHALVRVAAAKGVPAVTHAFTDGRDTSPTGGEEYLAALESVIEEAGTGDVATVSGRYYAMDRDENWDRTRRAYDAIVNREAEWTAESAVAAVRESYDRDTTDEFVEPTLVDGGRPLSDGDAVVFYNFRADRARQLTRMLAGIRPEWAFDTDPPATRVVTMTEYDRSFDLPVAFPPREPADTLGEVLADEGLTQLRVAESEKYAHVTHFLNGGREVEFEGEIREIVASPDVPTYDQQPGMSAAGVTDAAIDLTRTHDSDVLVLNYANPDMVGHTGDYEAAIAAVEAVDEQLGRLVAFCREQGANVLVTADHGNADDMGTREEPHTAHTTNPVPFVYVDAGARSRNDLENASGEAVSGGGDGGKRVRDGGALRDVAPTLLALIGVEKPSVMTGESLLADE
jgi:2,3-bisphosphoglycerate-independent phosphoglycerate mutase